jgi:hypothetical protein
MKSVVFLLGLVTAFPVSAQTLTGNELLARCKGQLSDRRLANNENWCEGFLLGFSNGYIVGLIDGAPDAFQKDGNADRSLCIPENVTIGQARDVIVRFLEQNPAMRHGTAAYLSFTALSQAFPCPSRR